jgi:hypothetical protein
MSLEAGRDYRDVYFLKVDVAGHSLIVASNDADKADAAFDAFEDVVLSAVREAREKRRCTIGETWGWSGDGGFCIFQDDEESRARQTALSAADIILKELPALNERLARREVRGQIVARIALHKGTLRYKGDDRRGSIHSPELNLVSHIERVSPSNSLVITESIYRVLGPAGDKFSRLSPDFEGHVLYSTGLGTQSARQAEWERNVTRSHSGPLRTDIPLADLGLRGAFSQRALTDIFRRLLESATKLVWVMGVGLEGFRTDHERGVSDLVQRGLDVRILALEPDAGRAHIVIGEQTTSMPAWCDLETRSGYNQAAAGSLPAWVGRVNASAAQGGSTARLTCRYYWSVPSAALLIIDDTLFMSPFVGLASNVKLPTLELTTAGRIGSLWREHYQRVWDDETLSREGPR